MIPLILLVLACPPSPPATSEVVWTLPAGCAAPFDLRAYTLAADFQTRQDVARARVELEGLRNALVEARAERDAVRADAADRLADVANRLVAISDKLGEVQPKSSSGALWTSLGAGAVLVCGVGAYIAIQAEPAVKAGLAGVAGGVCGGGVAGLVWAWE